MKITPVKFDSKSLKANGECIANGTVWFRFTVIQGKNGIFASLPQRKGTKPGDDGNIPYYPEMRIPDESLYQEFQQAVRQEYQKVVTSGGQATAGEGSQDKVDQIPF